MYASRREANRYQLNTDGGGPNESADPANQAILNIRQMPVSQTHSASLSSTRFSAVDEILSTLGECWFERVDCHCNQPVVRHVNHGFLRSAQMNEDMLPTTTSVIVSPLGRTRQTASIITNCGQFPETIFDGRLDECLWPRIEAELQPIGGVKRLIDKFDGKIAVASSASACESDNRCGS